MSPRLCFSFVLIALLFAGRAAPASAATLKVSSFPSGAQVIVDGIETGKVTPMNISLAEGEHVVTVQIPGGGWRADTRTITIGEGSNDLSVTLLPMITSGPPGPKGDKGEPGPPGPKGDPGSPGVRANADPPCVDQVNRLVNCGNGTVTDTVTRLVWLKQADCLGSADWVTATAAVAALAEGACGLNDGSRPGDWRLPTEDEWSKTIHNAAALGCTGNRSPSLTDDAGTGCLVEGSSSFAALPLSLLRSTFWGSTTFETFPSCTASALLGDGIVGCLGVRASLTLRIWPVRGGRP